MIDIVRQGFDAGLRYGDVLERDMVAVPVAPASEAILVASPHYLRARSSSPNSPDDLLEHRAVMCRSQVTGLIKPWVLRSGDETREIAPPAASIVHDLASQIELTVRGLGILSAPSAIVSELLRSGQLSRLLPTWSSPVPPLYIYFTNRRHQSAALRAFVAFLKDRPVLLQAESKARSGSQLVSTPVTGTDKNVIAASRAVRRRSPAGIAR